MYYVCSVQSCIDIVVLYPRDNTTEMSPHIKAMTRTFELDRLFIQDLYATKTAFFRQFPCLYVCLAQHQTSGLNNKCLNKIIPWA